MKNLFKAMLIASVMTGISGVSYGMFAPKKRKKEGLADFLTTLEKNTSENKFDPDALNTLGEIAGVLEKRNTKNDREIKAVCTYVEDLLDARVNAIKNGNEEEEKGEELVQIFTKYIIKVQKKLPGENDKLKAKGKSELNDFLGKKFSQVDDELHGFAKSNANAKILKKLLELNKKTKLKTIDAELVKLRESKMKLVLASSGDGDVSLDQAFLLSMQKKTKQFERMTKEVENLKENQKNQQQELNSLIPDDV